VVKFIEAKVMSVLKRCEKPQASFIVYELTSFPGGHREGEIPDPIPNSEVKPLFADGTVHKSTGE
jgi:hypothetical protein